jgi:hypothetical protein
MLQAMDPQRPARLACCGKSEHGTVKCRCVCHRCHVPLAQSGARARSRSHCVVRCASATAHASTRTLSTRTLSSGQPASKCPLLRAVLSHRPSGSAEPRSRDAQEDAREAFRCSTATPCAVSTHTCERGGGRARAGQLHSVTHARCDLCACRVAAGHASAPSCGSAHS